MQIREYYIDSSKDKLRISVADGYTQTEVSYQGNILYVFKSRGELLRGRIFELPTKQKLRSVLCSPTEQPTAFV